MPAKAHTNTRTTGMIASATSAHDVAWTGGLENIAENVVF